MVVDQESDKLTKWMLHLSPLKTFLLFGLLNPLSVIWLYKVGLYAIKNTRKSSTIFKTFSIVLILMIIGFFISEFIVEIPYYNSSKYISICITILIIALWIVCIIITAKAMIDYENKSNEYFGGAYKYKEYILRFLHLFYFPLAIYWIQQEVNAYE